MVYVWNTPYDKLINKTPIIIKTTPASRSFIPFSLKIKYPQNTLNVVLNRFIEITYATSVKLMAVICTSIVIAPKKPIGKSILKLRGISFIRSRDFMIIMIAIPAPREMVTVIAQKNGDEFWTPTLSILAVILHRKAVTIEIISTMLR